MRTPDKQNIVFISHTFPTQNDSSYGVFIKNELELLSSTINIKLLIPRPYLRELNFIDFQEKRSIVKYISVPRKKFPKITKFFLTNSVLKKLKSSSTDIVHIHWLYPSGLLIPTLKEEGFKTVLTIHGGDWYQNNTNPSFKDLFKTILQKADAIITVSDALRIDILKKFPVLSKKIHSVPHSIDTTFFKPSSNKKQLQNEIRFEPFIKHILCVANLYPLKGVHILLDALINEVEYKDFKLHLVSPRSDNNYASSLNDKINLLKERGRLKTYPSMEKSRLLKLYQASDIFILPSIKEGFGIVLAEALSCGLPCISTYSGGPQTILNNKTGILCAPDNVKELSRSIDKVLSELSSYTSSDLHRYIVDNFNIEKKINLLSGVYDGVIND